MMDVPRGSSPSKVTLIFLAIIFSLSAVGVASGRKPLPSDPSLDPLSPEAGSFLDTDLAVLMRKADDAYAVGDMKAAAGAYLELLRHDISDTTALYNLACCFGRMGDASKAARFLVKAVEAGFEDLGQVRRDPDFNRVRGKTAFDLAVDGVAARLRTREEQWGERVLLSATAPVVCRVRLPSGQKGSKPPPLLVALHGFASRPESLTPLWGALERPAFILAAPQGPFALPGKGRPGYSWRAPLPDDTREDDLRALALTERYLVEVIRDLKARYGAGDIYLMGFSQGAYFTYAAGLRHPELLAGLMSFGGRLPRDLVDGAVLEAGRSLRVFIAHGSRDPAVPPSEGEQALALLKEGGYDVTMVRFEGGHEMPEPVFRQAAEWIALSRPGAVVEKGAAVRPAMIMGGPR